MVYSSKQLMKLVSLGLYDDTLLRVVGVDKRSPQSDGLNFKPWPLLKEIPNSLEKNPK